MFLVQLVFAFKSGKLGSCSDWPLSPTPVSMLNAFSVSFYTNQKGKQHFWMRKELEKKRKIFCTISALILIPVNKQNNIAVLFCCVLFCYVRLVLCPPTHNAPTSIFIFPFYFYRTSFSKACIFVVNINKSSNFSYYVFNIYLIEVVAKSLFSGLKPRG